MIINDLYNNKKFVAEGKKPDNYHIVNKDGKPASLASYADQASAVKDRDAKHPGAEVRQVGPRGKVKGVAEGGIATVGWPDEDNHTGSNPPVSVGGTFDARPVVKRGSLVKASGLSGVYRVMDILRDEAKIFQEIPMTGQSTYVPMSDLRVWTNKPIVREQGMSEDNAGVPVHRISLTVTDPNHPMVSKRSETIQKTVRVPGADREKAINSAIAHYRRKGYRVHDHHYIGTVDDEPMAEGPVTKKPQPYNDPDWIKKLPKDQLDALGGKRYSKDKKPVSEVSLGDYRKKAAVSQAGAKIDRFFGRDDPAKVAAADQTIAKRQQGLDRADVRANAYVPPQAEPVDLEKQQRELTAKYPNIDELVRKAELNRDPDYEMADGQAYYAARDAEQNYQKLKQIQRVIQGLNESLNRSHLP
jgi:hypothetical protein